MSDAIQQIGQFFSSPTGSGLLKGGTVGAGFLQNLLANREAQKKQKFVEDLITNPTKFASYVAGFERPLTKGLTTEVGREAQAFGAERGLGSSPAVMQDVFAQALAPYVQNEQQMALRQALEGLGLYESSPTTRPVDITSILKLLGNPNAAPTSTGGFQYPKIPTPPGPDTSADIPPYNPVGDIPLPTPTVGGGDVGIGDLGF